MKKLIRFASMCTCAAALLVTPAIADEPAKPATPSMDEKAMMDAWMEMAKLNENHKLLGSMVGTWEYKMQCWMGPEPKTTKGTAKHVAIMDGRFIHSEHDGEMLMPGPDGKDVTKPFHGASVTGYDNVKGKFVRRHVRPGVQDLQLHRRDERPDESGKEGQVPLHHRDQGQ
jgi:hypothetical protein